jgi:predicted nucleic acid-binding protein
MRKAKIASIVSEDEELDRVKDIRRIWLSNVTG